MRKSSFQSSIFMSTIPSLQVPTLAEVQSPFDLKTQQVLQQELRHILSEPGPFHAIESRNWKTWWIAAGLALSPLTYLSLALFRRKRHLESIDIRGTRKKKALKKLIRQLKHPNSSSPSQIGEAMEQFLMAKTECDRSLLSREWIVEQFQRTDPDLAMQWDALWMDIDMARYGTHDGNVEDFSQRLLSLAKRTEQV